MKNEERGTQPRPPRGNLGRRSGDYDPRTTLTKKVLVVLVAAINALYFVGEVWLSGHVCP